jgi:sulfate permease, SulP family
VTRRPVTRRPILFASLRGYRLAALPGDAIAGLTLAAIAIPEQLATSKLAGMPPMAGLLAFAAGSIAFAAFGANRFLSAGADSTIAPIMASALLALAAAGSPTYAAAAGTLAVMVGLLLLASGVLRLGWIADLLSVPVTTGFLAGISVHIIAGQLPSILGIDAPHGPLVDRLVETAARLPEAHTLPMLIGFGVLACAALAERISALIPGALIGLAAGGAAVWLLHWQVPVMGALPVTMPTIGLAMPDWGTFTALVSPALIVALVCIMQTAAVVRSFPSEPDGEENVSRDFGAVGMGCILAAVAGAFTVNASPPRTAVVTSSGGRSQLAGLVAVIVVALAALLAAQAFAYVPEAALGGVLVFIACRIFRLRTMIQVARQGGWEILLVLASAALVVLLPIQIGVTLSIVLSMLHSITMIARPKCAVLARVPGTTVWWALEKNEAAEHVPGVVVFAPGAPITFMNASYIRRALNDAVAAEPCRLVVIEANGVIDIDFTGAQILRHAIAALHARRIDVAVARLESARAAVSTRRTGLAATLGGGRIFRSVEEAIKALGQGQGSALDPQGAGRPLDPNT